MNLYVSKKAMLDNKKYSEIFVIGTLYVVFIQKILYKIRIESCGFLSTCRAA